MVVLVCSDVFLDQLGSVSARVTKGFRHGTAVLVMGTNNAYVDILYLIVAWWLPNLLVS